MVHVIWGEGWCRAYLLLQLLYVFLARNRFHGVLSVYNQQFYHNPSMGSRWTYRFASRHFNHHLLFIIAQGYLTTMTFWVMLSSQLQLHGIKKNVVSLQLYIGHAFFFISFIFCNDYLSAIPQRRRDTTFEINMDSHCKKDAG